MTLLLKRLVTLLLSTSLVSCVSLKTSDWQASITLPASQDCYSFSVMSGKELRLSSDDPVCIYLKSHSIWISSDSYRILRSDIQKNCQYHQCAQMIGALDNLFLKIDAALKLMKDKK